MNASIITFFNKGGVGKTSLVYHLSWMLAELGHHVIAADLDPQANLTASFLDEEQIERLWSTNQPRTIWSAIRPFVNDEGIIKQITPTTIDEERFLLLPSDLTLSRFEDELSSRNEISYPFEHSCRPLSCNDAPTPADLLFHSSYLASNG